LIQLKTVTLNAFRELLERRRLEWS
jgi:hypothetical protein